MKMSSALIAMLFLVLVTGISVSAQTNLTSLDGDRIDIDGQAGKVVVLAIGASWLPLSDKQAEFTNSLAKRYEGKDVVVFFVTTDSTNPDSRNYASKEALRKFASASKLSVTVLHDADGAVTFKKFRIEQVPSFVILDKKGKMAGEPFGGIDPKYDITLPLSKIIDRLMEQVR